MWVAVAVSMVVGLAGISLAGPGRNRGCPQSGVGLTVPVQLVESAQGFPLTVEAVVRPAEMLVGLQFLETEGGATHGVLGPAVVGGCYHGGLVELNVV